MPRFGHLKTLNSTTATSVTNGQNALLEYVGSVGKYSCRGRLRGLDERLTGFGIRGFAERRVERLFRGLSFWVPAAVSSAVGRVEGRPCWAGLLQKASIAGYHSFFCALSAILSATSLIAPLALPTAF